MERKQNQKSSIILKYNKRRFDGGSEIEQIRQIEYKQTVAQLDKLYGQQNEQQANLRTNTLSNSAAAPNLAPALPPAQPLVEPVTELNELPAPKSESKLDKRSQKLLEVWILGPMELCVGVVGMLTSLLAIFTFTRMQNEALVKQSKGVFKDCLKTFNKGLLDTVTAPVKALKVAVKA